MGEEDAKDHAEVTAEVDREEATNGEEHGDAEGGGKKKKNYRKKGGDEDAPDRDAAGGRAYPRLQGSAALCGVRGCTLDNGGGGSESARGARARGHAGTRARGRWLALCGAWG